MAALAGVGPLEFTDLDVHDVEVPEIRPKHGIALRAVFSSSADDISGPTYMHGTANWSQCRAAVRDMPWSALAMSDREATRALAARAWPPR